MASETSQDYCMFMKYIPTETGFDSLKELSPFAFHISGLQRAWKMPSAPKLEKDGTCLRQ